MKRHFSEQCMMLASHVLKTFALAVFVCLWLPNIGQAQTCTVNIVGGSTFGTIQAAVNAAATGATIQVSGTCNENVSINERKEGITLEAQGTATINGPSSSSATVAIRGRGTFIHGFNITGGQSGIQVLRGTATIDNNIIQSTGSNGILVNQSSFAIIINNVVQNNLGGIGIAIDENSAARIGVVTGSDGVASPNIVQNNGDRGISVTRASNARIVGNTISGNASDGIGVFRGAHANASNNTINANAGSGIFVSQNSGVNLGNDTGTTIFDLPNSTTVNNAAFGIRCALNSYVNGSQGNVNGASGATNIAGSCVNSLSP